MQKKKLIERTIWDVILKQSTSTKEQERPSGCGFATSAAASAGTANITAGSIATGSATTTIGQQLWLEKNVISHASAKSTRDAAYRTCQHQQRIWRRISRSHRRANRRFTRSRSNSSLLELKPITKRTHICSRHYWRMERFTGRFASNFRYHFKNVELERKLRSKWFFTVKLHTYPYAKIW